MKTKVVAFRVTQEEYDALVFNAKAINLKLSDFLLDRLEEDIKECMIYQRQEQKRLELKAKREAKKAAT